MSHLPRAKHGPLSKTHLMQAQSHNCQWTVFINMAYIDTNIKLNNFSKPLELRLTLDCWLGLGSGLVLWIAF